MRGAQIWPVSTGWVWTRSAGLLLPLAGAVSSRTVAQQPMPTNPTLAACARQAFRGTQGVARRNDLSASASSTTPAGPARPFRLARVPRTGMTNTNVRLGTHRPHTDVRSADQGQPQRGRGTVFQKGGQQLTTD